MSDRPWRTIPYGPGELAVPGGPFALDTVELPRVRTAPLGPCELTGILDRPAGGPAFEDVFHGSRSVLVVVSDATRATGAASFLPLLLSRIERACRAEVTFAVASGIHAAPTEGDVARVLGGDLAGTHRVVLHDPDDARSLEEIGRTRQGTRVVVNRALREHDRVVLTGGIGFHYYAGFSGGRKAVVPGLASRETVTRNHLRALLPDGKRHPGAAAGRLDGNPVHRDMAEGASMVGAHLLVNTVIDAAGRIERLFAGHWRSAHLAGCAYLRATRTVRLDPRRLVVASAGGDPGDVNVIQSHKAFEAAANALTPGGVFVLVARCGEGVGHPDFLPALDLGSESAIVEALVADFRVYAQTALSWAKKARRFRLVLVSDLPAALVRRLGAEPAESLEAAFAFARSTLPEGSAGWLFPHAPRLLVQALRTPETAAVA